MDLDVIFIGTAGSLPSASRGLSSMLIRRGGERFLIDCGEGTQRQLMRSVGLAEIDAILITHTHADHILGLPGILKTFALRERERPLVLAGPPPLGRLLQDMRPLIGTLPYDIELELGQGNVVWHGDGFQIRSVEVDHRVPANGWVLSEDERPGRFNPERARELGVNPGADFGRLQRGIEIDLGQGRIVKPSDVMGLGRAGRTIVYSGDTKACSVLRDASINADLLVHEATFLSEDADRADLTAHSTAQDAALTAAAANVKMLALTHVTARYPVRVIEAEARSVFERSVVVRDFDLIEIPLPERGSAKVIRRGGRPKPAPENIVFEVKK